MTWHRGWIPPHVGTNLGNSGPIRVQANEVLDDTIVTRPVGFNTVASALHIAAWQPPDRLRIRKRAGWWRWFCPWCPTKVGGLCPTWGQALDAALRHASTAHEEPR